MKTFLKSILIVLGVATTAVVFSLAIYWNDIRRMPEIASGFYAKELCSCVFVTEQTEDYCRELVRQYIPASKLVINREKKIVEAVTLGSIRTASWTSDRYGCVLNRN